MDRTQLQDRNAITGRQATGQVQVKACKVCGQDSSVDFYFQPCSCHNFGLESGQGMFIPLCPEHAGKAHVTGWLENRLKR